MANPIIQAVYDLKDNITGKLKIIGDALKGNQSASDKFATGVERNNKRVSDSYAKSADGIGKLKTALVAIGAFVGLEKIKDGLAAIVAEGENFDDLGKQFATAFGGLDKGAEALERVRDFAKTVPQSFEDVSAAAIKLRQLGFDPLDGTLQALIDNQNALNQSQDGLLATIDALGKANIKGGVNLKSLVALTESGIPVFDLLGKSLGVSSDRVRELANEGKLTQDSIKSLIGELGKLRAGAAADELGDSDSQLTKLKDTAKEFLDTIAHSGALDVFRAELKNLNAEVHAAAKDGRLKTLAKEISDGIVATAGAIKSAVGFVVDYSGALIELGKTYIVFRGLSFASSVLDGATAMRAAAQAAKLAAGESAAAVGVFGKLGAAAKSIPSSIKIGIAAIGAEIVISSLQTILAALREEETILNETSTEIDKNAAAHRKLAAQIKATKDQTKQYADVAVLSNEALKEQTNSQLKAYAAALIGARAYYNALAVQAKDAGNTLKLDEANAHLASLGDAIDAVNLQLAGTRLAAEVASIGLTDGAKKASVALLEMGDDAKAVGEFVTKAFDALDLTKPTAEIGDFAMGIDAVAARGGKAAEIIDATLLESLKKLSGQDLLRFQTEAIAAMDAVGGASEKNSATLKATLEAALDRLGVKAEDTGVKITKTGADTIATFNAIATNVQATAQTIEAAFDAALAGTKTVDEAKALGAALQIAFSAGRVGAKELADATRDLDERIRTLTASISPLASQFELLGIKSQAQLNAVRDNAAEAFDAIVNGAREGTAAQEDVVRAFKVYVDAARAAAAESGASAKATLEDQLAVKASVLGLSDSFVKAGEEGKKAGDATAQGFDNAKEAIGGASDELQRFGQDTSAAAIASDRIGESAKANAAAIGTVIALTIEQRKALQQLNEELQRGGNLESLSLDSAKNLLAELGDAAGAQTQVLIAHINELQAAADRTEQAAQRIKDETASIQDQIDQIEGNEAGIEDRRHAKKLADLKEEAEANGTASTAAYRNLIDLENKLHDLKLKNLTTEGRTSGTGGGNGGGLSNGGGGLGNPPRPGGNTPPVPQPAPAPNRTGTAQPSVNVTANVVLLSGDEASRKKLAQLISRDVFTEIQTIQGRSR